MGPWRKIQGPLPIIYRLSIIQIPLPHMEPRDHNYVTIQSVRSGHIAMHCEGVREGMAWLILSMAAAGMAE